MILKNNTTLFKKLIKKNQKIDKEKLIVIRKKLNVFLKTEVASEKEFSQEEKEAINQRLRGLGYIQ